MSGEHFFPPFIRALPRPDTKVPQEAWIAPNDHILSMFYEVQEDVVVAAHRHGPQWGVVLAGEMDMEIEGVRRTYRRGDVYYVPDGAQHTAWISAGYRGIDVFADATRYRPLP
jgi:quercetin dioxygenase-like cupin family protein